MVVVRFEDHAAILIILISAHLEPVAALASVYGWICCNQAQHSNVSIFLVVDSDLLVRSWPDT